MNRRQFIGSLIALAATHFLPKPKMVTMPRTWRKTTKVTHYSQFKLYAQELGRAMRDTKDQEIASILAGGSQTCVASEDPGSPRGKVAAPALNNAKEAYHAKTY